jgi:hypothetical protein
MKTEVLNVTEEIAEEEESLKEQLLYLLVAKDETWAMINHLPPSNRLGV